jgi:N-acetylglucosaminyl-diphospho-decaprenol L-rhamnosyltransferase
VIAPSSGSTAGRLDIVIVNYETPDLVDDSLRSIAELAPAILQQLIVVDNSTDPEPAESVVRRHPSSRLVRPGSNVGYGAGANHGVAAGTAEYVLVLNADARLDEGAVEALVGDLERHPEAGIAGPRLLDSNGVPQPSCSRFPTPGRLVMHETGLWKLMRSTRFGERLAPFFDPGVAATVPCVLGAALCIRRSDFDSVGGFDPEYFMYYEEVDLCRRLLDRGVVTRYVPSATIGHIGAASTAAHHAAMQREMLRSLARYMRRDGAGRKLLRLRAAAVAAATAWLARDVLHPPGRTGRLQFRRSAALWRAVVGDAMAGWDRA